VTAQFTTAGLGVIPGTDGDVDHVIRRQAWEREHEGGSVSREESAQLVYAARWPDGSLAATAYGKLGDLMDKLDLAEEEHRCPVHGSPS
jgi:hypothetical protein